MKDEKGEYYLQIKEKKHCATARSSSGDTAVLFVHGIQGSPAQFRFLTERLEPEAAFYNLLLPGHGDSVATFRKSGAEEWQACVNEAARKLRSKYKRLIFVGHSMGCLLGLTALREENIRFDGMLLIACPLKLRFTFRYIKHNYLAMVMKNSANPFLKAAREANSVCAAHPWRFLSCVHPYLELLRLMKRTRRALQPLGCTALALHMERDEIVSARSLELLTHVCGIEGETCKECGHNYFTSDVREMMARRLEAMCAAR